jgi:predicted transcriptional regulator
VLTHSLLPTEVFPMASRRGKTRGCKWRERIYAAIVLKPGIHYNKLKGLLEISNNPLHHNLEALKREGKIYVSRDGPLMRYYPVDVITPPEDFLGVREMIAIAFRDDPGLSQAQIALVLNDSRQRIHYHITRMRSEGLLDVKRTGNGATKVYFATTTLANDLKKAIFGRSLPIRKECGQNPRAVKKVEQF